MDTERMPERGILFHFRSQNTNIEPSLSVVINTFGRVISPITPQVQEISVINAQRASIPPISG